MSVCVCGVCMCVCVCTCMQMKNVNSTHLGVKGYRAVLTGIFLLLVGISRIKLSCHTAPQVFGGFILGLVIAFIFNWLDDKYFSKNKKYLADKARILSLFDRN